MCEKLARTLIKNGFTVEGVPGFYKRNGVWTVMFCSYTNGILIPIREIDGKRIMPNRLYNVNLEESEKTEYDKKRVA